MIQKLKWIMGDDIKNENDYHGKWGMHYGASPIISKLAEELRGRMTEAEKILWNIIKKNDWQLNFRRQHPLSIYIADFYCHKIKISNRIRWRLSRNQGCENL